MHKVNERRKKSSEVRQSCGKIHANNLKYKVHKSHWVACTFKLRQRNTETFSLHVTLLLILCPVMELFQALTNSYFMI